MTFSRTVFAGSFRAAFAWQDKIAFEFGGQLLDVCLSVADTCSVIVTSENSEVIDSVVEFVTIKE